MTYTLAIDKHVVVTQSSGVEFCACDLTVDSKFLTENGCGVGFVLKNTGLAVLGVDKELKVAVDVNELAIFKLVRFALEVFVERHCRSAVGIEDRNFDVVPVCSFVLASAHIGTEAEVAQSERAACVSELVDYSAVNRCCHNAALHFYFKTMLRAKQSCCRNGVNLRIAPRWRRTAGINVATHTGICMVFGIYRPHEEIVCSGVAENNLGVVVYQRHVGLYCIVQIRVELAVINSPRIYIAVCTHSQTSVDGIACGKGDCSGVVEVLAVENIVFFVAGGEVVVVRALVCACIHFASVGADADAAVGEFAFALVNKDIVDICLCFCSVVGHIDAKHIFAALFDFDFILKRNFGQT